MAGSARDQAKQIASTLRAHHHELMDRWVELAKGDKQGVPRAAELDRDALLNYVPLLLEEIASALDRIDPEVDATVAARDRNALGAAIHHAEHRYSQGYTISEVLRELGHFRVAMHELCGRYGTPLVGPAGRLAHALVDDAIGGGADAIERRERELLDADRRRVEEVARAKDDFISLVSHELRTPLNVILGWAQLARARSDLDRLLVTAFETIERNAVLQARLIDDLLDLARMRNRKLSLELRTIDPLDAVRVAVEGFRPTAMAQQVELRLNAPAGLPRVVGDFDRLHQIFVNLLANALKFTPPRGRIEVDATCVDSNVRIAVRDTGIGIAPELLPEIFDPFRQGDPAAGKRKGGVGLGLALVRELAQLHGGRAFAESPGVGRGSTFFVELPAARTTAVSPQP